MSGKTYCSYCRGITFTFNQEPRTVSADGRQLEVPVVLPHSEMLPKNYARFCPEFSIERDEIFRPPSLFCRILDRVGEAEAGSGGDQPAEE